MASRVTKPPQPTTPFSASRDAAPDDYARALAELRATLSSSSVAEPPMPSDDPARGHEHAVQYAWNEQLLREGALQTASGRTLRILDPGQWSGERGPDFRMAEIEIGGQRMRGDVEIHVDSRDWARHGHGRDFEYNNVVLHVVLRNTDDATHDLLHNGTRAERFELEPWLEPDFETIVSMLAFLDDTPLEPPEPEEGTEDMTDRTNGTDRTDRTSGGGERDGVGGAEDFFPGSPATTDTAAMSHTSYKSHSSHPSYRPAPAATPCAAALARVQPAALINFFRAAGRKRLEQRARRVADQRWKDPADQVFYQSLMAAMGYKGAKTLFFLLARRVPLEELRRDIVRIPAEDHAAALESTLLGVANLLQIPPQKSGDGARDIDGETFLHFDRLKLYWEIHSRYYADRLLPPTRRWFASVRPVNFPTRRIAGIARLLARAGIADGRGLCESLYEAFRRESLRKPNTAREIRRCINALAEWFVVEGAGYWSTRYTFGGKPATRVMKLVGEDRAASLLLNVGLPTVLADARAHGDAEMEEFVWLLFANFPALQVNTVSRFMMRRLFGAGAVPTGLNFRLEREQQALLHIYHTCCSQTGADCASCLFAGEPLG